MKVRTCKNEYAGIEGTTSAGQSAQIGLVGVCMPRTNMHICRRHVTATAASIAYETARLHSEWNCRKSDVQTCRPYSRTRPACRNKLQYMPHATISQRSDIIYMSEAGANLALGGHL